MSAPLILGLDLTQHDKLAAIIPIITNKDALAVNQQWAGHPGRLVQELSPSGKPGKYVAAQPCSGSAAQKGWKFDAGVVRASGGCLDASVRTELQIKPCDGSNAQKFTYEGKTLKAADGSCVDANDWTKGNVWLYKCNGGTNQQIEFSNDGTVCDACGESRKRCFEVTPSDPSGGSSGGKVQVWAKPQPGGAVAMLIINPTTDAYAADVALSDIGIKAASAHMRDIWAQKDLGVVKDLKAGVPSLDSVFYLVTP